MFAGHNTVHRVAPVASDIDRVIAVYSYADNDDVVMTPTERLGFSGRAEPLHRPWDC